jgi:CRISPR-associated protein Cas2
MLMTYDVNAKRTEKFKKLLRRYLNHDQNSVFSGDITEAQAIELHHELSQIMIPADNLTEITARNRKNVDVVHLIKNNKGEVKREPIEDHRRDFGVL